MERTETAVDKGPPKKKEIKSEHESNTDPRPTPIRIVESETLSYRNPTIIDSSKKLPVTAQLDSASSKYRITAAMCHKTLFGNIDLDRVALWAAYNRMLGFDRVYIWYHSDIKNSRGFDELESLPYVNMVENTQARIKRYPDGTIMTEREEKPVIKSRMRQSASKTRPRALIGS
jgi:hypothetical protein